MRLSSNVAGMIAALGLWACSSGTRTAQAPESNPWADYKGTFAPGGEGTSAAEAKSDSKPKSATKASGPKSAGKPKAEAAPDAQPPDASTDERTKKVAGRKAGAKKPPAKH